MYDTVIDTKVLDHHRDDPNWCIVDCRASLADPTSGAEAYRRGHIPRAVFADLATDLSGLLVPGVTGRHPLPEATALAQTFGRWGIEADTQVIAYDAGNSAFAARLWWLLRWLGHARVAVLDGGLDAWKAAGLPLRTGDERRRASRFPVRQSLTRTVSTIDILTRAQQLRLVDARSAPRFRGEVEPIDPVAGHIPNAVCAPFEGNLDEHNRFLPPAQLRARFAADVATARDIVCYCGSGVTACHNILAFHRAGLPEPALYPGSFSEWITDPARPVERSTNNA
jgi:thiosulfate/3-mercaptopyruvate sulfurtransferase